MSQLLGSGDIGNGMSECNASAAIAAIAAALRVAQDVLRNVFSL
jgi:hypothetical protein